MSLPDLMAYLDGKSVAIVGNASSLLHHDCGAAIDGHDVVVRMNKGIPVNPAAQGRRWDICCFSTMPEIGDLLQKISPRFAVWMSPRARRKYERAPKLCFYPLDHWQALHDRLGQRPSVGAMTIDLVSRSAARTASVYGFDFKASGTFYTPDQHIGPHDYRAESRYVLDLSAQRSWRFVDTALFQAGERKIG
jgi:hypothetical protein